MTVVFVKLDNTKLELLHPLGDKSPIQGFLDKNKTGQTVWSWVTRGKLLTPAKMSEVKLKSKNFVNNLALAI